MGAASEVPPPFRNAKQSMLVPILERVAHRIGARVEVEPEWRFAGRVVFASGGATYFRGSSLDVNPHGASEIAKDKGFANHFLSRLGFPVAHAQSFFSPEWAQIVGSDRGLEAAVRYAEARGYPLVAKPNGGSQGSGVHMVRDEARLREVLGELFATHRVVLLQEVIAGDDFRVVVLGDRVISAYQRLPLSVTGDGRSSIGELLVEKQNGFFRDNRNTRVPIDDPRIPARLAEQGRSLNTVLKAGEEAALLFNANLSSGGDAKDVTGRVAPHLEAACIAITRGMGLQLCGVDLLVQGDIADAASTYVALEVNSSPGLDNYAALGPEQARRVDDLYTDVLTFLEARC